MRKFWLLPGLLVLSVACLGCGGGDEKEGEKADAGGKGKPADNAAADNAAAGKTDDFPAPGRPAKIGVDSSYVLPEAVFAVVVHPSQVLKSPLISGNPMLAGNVAQFKSELGIDPDTIEQVVISGGPPEDPTAGAPVTIVARFSSPHKGKEMLEAAVKKDNPDGEVEEVAYADKVYYRAKKMEPPTDAADEDDPFGGPGFGPPQPKLPCVYFPDDKTAVMAEEEPLKRVLDAKEPVKSPLTDQMAKLDVSGDLAGVLVMNDQLREMAKSSGGPKTDTVLDDLPQDLQHAVLSASLSPKIMVQTTLTLEETPTAKEVDGAIKKSVQEGVADIKKQLAEMDKAPADDPFIGMIKPMLQEAQKIVSGISSRQSGPNVTIELTGLDDVNLEALGPGIMMMMMGGMMGGGGPPGGDFGPPGADFPPPADDAEGAEEVIVEEEKESDQ